MGRRFLGYEVGEQDGYYIAAIASGYMPASRQEAQKLFWDWHEKEHNAPTHHFLTYLGSMNFPHQFGAMGYRMVGYEDSQVLPSTMMRWAFLRGAGKQYGLLSYTLISIFNRFGHKNYLKSGKGRSAHYDYGPDKGPSLSLLKRLYYVIFMYGAASSGFEVPDIACVTNEKDKEGYPKLSPLGEINVKGVEWCRKYGEKRGIQYAPVALLIDFASGWVPPKHFAAPGNRYLVWGNMPYKKGDYQIDNFFRWVYPQYEDCAYFKDERGYLTPTPFGDKFDVLTSDVQEHILGQYSVICLLGEIDLTPSLIKMLKGFVKKGGTIILSAEDARGFGSSFSGLSIGSRREGYGSLSLFDRKIFKEKDYIYTEVTPKKAKVLAVNEDKLPLITLSDYGKGRVVVLTPDYWMTDRLKVGDLAHRDVHPARYELLNVVKHVLGKYFKDLDLVRVDGSKIQYIVNLTKDDKSLLLTLVNNDKETDWEGTISLKDGKIVSIREWMEGKQLSVRRPIKVKVPRGDLRVFKITSDKPLFYQKKY